MDYLKQKFGLEGKTAVITGGGGTLCGQMALAYAKAGASVVLWDKNEDHIEKRLKWISDETNAKAKASAVKVNLMEEESIKNALEKTVSENGKIDVLINGAGGNRGKGPLTEINAEDFEFVLKLNLLAGCVLPTKHMASYWINENIKGTIIHIASMAGFNPLSGVWAYSSAKAAVMNQTMAHAKELAPHGIRVNAIAPGFFIADQNRKLLLNDDGSPTQRGKDVLERTPMDRFGEPEDLSAAALFLGSEGSSFVSGIVLPVDGAYLCNNI
ncbi:MAG: SDR family NAD(P)-dependent oxidoreductase [Fibrobacterota bacterium]